jgi:hypothetical protein
MRELRGQVTIFISMIMMCVFALFCCLLESSRTAGARWYLQTAVASAMDSVFSQYHRRLWDSYRLLFAEYEREEELEADFSLFLQSYLDTENWYPMELQTVKLEEWQKAVDNTGIYLEEEILDYMRYGIWDMDFNEDTVSSLWADGEQADAVKTVAETYRGHADDALKLEKSLEAISESQEKQLNMKQEGSARLRSYNGAGFRQIAASLIREQKRMPGLVKNYRRQADALAAKLNASRKMFTEESGRCSSQVEDQLDGEIQQFEAYVDQDGERRREVESLEGQSYEQVALVEAVIRESEEVERIIDEWESDDEDDEGPDLEALWSPVIRHFEQLTIHSLSFTHGVKDKEKEGWLKQVEKLYRSGMLELVLPEGTEVSKGVLETPELPSENGLLSEGKRGIPLLNHLLVNEYCGKFFRYFPIAEERQTGEKNGREVGVEGSGGLTYEIEYLIGGKKLDEENLVYVVNRLLAIREGLNLIHILSDSQKRQEAQKLAMMITGVAGLSPLVLLTTFFVMSVWALGESLMDIRGLLAGKKVMIFKTSADWTLNLENLLTMGQEGEIGTGGNERGLGYLSWLKILLFMDEIVCQEYRMMDMIQMNICREQSSFRIRRGIYRARIKGMLTGKHVFFSLGFMEHATGGRDHTYPMEATIERKY